MPPPADRILTPVGPARILQERPARPARDGRSAGLLVLGHGAGRGAGVDAPDLLAARDAGLAAGLTVVRVEQPWYVAGRAVAEAPVRLDAAWAAVLAALQAQETGPLVVGGRSSGARVACRTAAASGAVGVLALGFPLSPPGRPDRTRLPELLAPDVPRLVVQGERDAFGVPSPAQGVQVHVVRGADHAFSVRRRDGRSPQEVTAEVRGAVERWLSVVVTAPQTLT